VIYVLKYNPENFSIDCEQRESAPNYKLMR